MTAGDRRRHESSIPLETVEHPPRKELLLMSASTPVTESQLGATLDELRESVENRIDAKCADLRAYLEKRLNDQTKWLIA